MHSELFDRANLEVTGEQRSALQNSQMLRVWLGPDVLATKGAMVAFQGSVEFHHEKAGSMGKLLKKMVTSEDNPLMRVTGEGEVFFASRAGFVNVVELTGDAISVSVRNPLAFDASLDWDINRTKGAGVMAGGLFNTTVSGRGMVALHTVGKPVVLDCAQQPTYVDTQACVAWSANLQPAMVSSMKSKSMLRGGSGEAFQFAFHGPRLRRGAGRRVGPAVVRLVVRWRRAARRPAQLNLPRTNRTPTRQSGGAGVLGSVRRGRQRCEVTPRRE